MLRARVFARHAGNGIIDVGEAGETVRKQRCRIDMYCKYYVWQRECGKELLVCVIVCLNRSARNGSNTEDTVR